MHFHSPAGEPCVHVPHSSDGQRLQRFASQAFREELGRGGGHLHGACKHAASQATFLVNGSERPGRHVLSAGDVRSENAGGSNNSSSMQVSLLGAIGAASGAVARAANAARNRAA